MLENLSALEIIMILAALVVGYGAVFAMLSSSQNHKNTESENPTSKPTRQDET